MNLDRIWALMNLWSVAKTFYAKFSGILQPYFGTLIGWHFFTSFVANSRVSNPDFPGFQGIFNFKFQGFQGFSCRLFVVFKDFKEIHNIQCVGFELRNCLAIKVTLNFKISRVSRVEILHFKAAQNILIFQGFQGKFQG